MIKQEPLERAATIQSVGYAGNRLHRKLSSFGVLLLTLSCLSPFFSIYGVGSDVLLHAGTGAAGMFICGIGVALVWAVVYAELGSAYPRAENMICAIMALKIASQFVVGLAWSTRLDPKRSSPVTASVACQKPSSMQTSRRQSRIS
jgi:hypothetical protein